MRTRTVFSQLILLHLLLVCAWSNMPGAYQLENSDEGSDSVGKKLMQLPLLTEELAAPVSTDWLVKKLDRRSGIYRTTNPFEIILTNGLISRTFRVQPNAATVGFKNLMTGASIIRAVRPEAVVEVSGSIYNAGGLTGQKELAYLLPEWIDSLKNDPLSMQLSSFETGIPLERFPWKRKRWCTNLPWPPPGAALTFNFEMPAGGPPRLIVSVHYEMYDGIPLISKWLTVRNGSAQKIRLEKFISENLAFVEQESLVDSPINWDLPDIHIESDYSFGGMSSRTSNRTTYWVKDSLFTSQVNYLLQTPCVLESRPPSGPHLEIEAGETFESFRTYELVFDKADKERKGLAKRRMYRTIAPWVTENPIFLHLTSTDPETVRRAIDQCAEVGFEMVILSFGSGLDMEDESLPNIEKYRSLTGYAHSKGVELGGYSLLASRRISEEDDVVNPVTGKTGGAIFGNSPCLCSKWGADYFRKISAFYEKTGFDVLEHDGSYPGDLCASRKHPYHDGLDDSQWKQWKKITDFYKWCRSKDVYLNVPDWYFLSGSTKTGIGYRETNWSLPRARQIILGRQNIFDGTWEKTPSMGWTFVPLVQYQGGGAEATLEPLSDHLKEYEAHLAQNFGSGIQACYRGPRLYDSEATKNLVKEWVSLYKKYRDILNSDIIHLRRADGKGIDWTMHVNPELKQKGFVMAYNPTGHAIQENLTLQLYYTGLASVASIRQKEGNATTFKLDRNYRVELPVEIPAGDYTWFVIE